MAAFREGINIELALQVKTIIIDKEPSEISAISVVFPDTAIQLCSFHVSRVLNDKTSKEPEAKPTIYQLRGTIENTEFQNLVKELEVKSSPTFFPYFEENWINCPQGWGNRDKMKSITFGNTTTNRVENHSSKIKMVLNCHSTLSEVIEKLLEIVKNKDEDVLYRDVIENLKDTARNFGVGTPSLASNTNPVLKQILQDLTKFSAKLQIWEHDSAPDEEEMAYYDSTESECCCLLFWSFELPCRHIYQKRRQAGL
ncbi:uncharacterized protein LOC127749220 [Frankliniella occidentalis]|uniref:Uncharacterized protein LOC127749220 n=1 Tax=Frankliniella occidentalis TaxID=133901 RepID=A0A9C6U3N1_FRAOC|nr:uncharacterized protein LOC127749220 [Frankliniella occidentalis]